MYTVEYRADLDLLDITWSGLFLPQDMADYAQACQACWQKARFQPGYRLRIVLTDGQALPQDTLVTLAGAFVDFPRAGRIAMVTASAIARLQIKRTMMVPEMRIFDTSEVALDWLLEP